MKGKDIVAGDRIVCVNADTRDEYLCDVTSSDGAATTYASGGGRVLRVTSPIAQQPFHVIVYADESVTVEMEGGNA